MNWKQTVVIVSAIIGLILVVLYPRWIYPDQVLRPGMRKIVYAKITNPPEPLSLQVRNEVNSRLINVIYVGKKMEPDIDYKDLSLRVGLIIIVAAVGFFILRTKGRRELSDKRAEQIAQTI